MATTKAMKWMTCVMHGGRDKSEEGKNRPIWRNLFTRGNNTSRGLGIYVPAQGIRSICDILPGLWVMFCEFVLNYGSALRRSALVMGNHDKKLRKKAFSSTNDTKHSLLTILVENFALFMGSYFKILPWLW